MRTFFHSWAESYFCWIPSLLLLVEKLDESGSDGMRQQIRTEYTCVLQIKCTQMLGIKIHTNTEIMMIGIRRKTEDYNSYAKYCGREFIKILGIWIHTNNWDLWKSFKHVDDESESLQWPSLKILFMEGSKADLIRKCWQLRQGSLPLSN